MKMNREIMARAFPERPARFDAAVDTALWRVREDAARGKSRARRTSWRRPAVAWALAACLLLTGTFGVAEAARRGVFGFLWREEDVLPEAGLLVRQDVARLSVGGTELAVTETAYDGATLRLVLSVRVPEIEEALKYSEIEGGNGAFSRALERDGVTAQYSFDRFRVNGEEYAMTGGSGGENAVGERDGEMLIYFELNLLGLDLPRGDATFELPVAVDAQGETVWMAIPVEEAALSSVRDVTPKSSVALEGGGTLTVVSAKLSPIAAYATVRLDFPEGAEEEAAAAIASWQRFTFVGADGEAVCPHTELTAWGLPQGETDGALHLEASIRCKAAESYPDELFLAPMGYYGEDGAYGADMAQAVPLGGE